MSNYFLIYFDRPHSTRSSKQAAPFRHRQHLNLALTVFVIDTHFLRRSHSITPSQFVVFVRIRCIVLICSPSFFLVSLICHCRYMIFFFFSSSSILPLVSSHFNLVSFRKVLFFLFSIFDFVFHSIIITFFMFLSRHHYRPAFLFFFAFTFSFILSVGFASIVVRVFSHLHLLHPPT